MHWYLHRVEEGGDKDKENERSVIFLNLFFRITNWFIIASEPYPDCESKSRNTKLPKHRNVNSFEFNVTFLYPLKTYGFLTFSRGIEMWHWTKKWVKSAWKCDKVRPLLYLIEILPPCPLTDDPHGMVCLTVISTFCTEDCK